MALRWRNYGKGKIYCAAQTKKQARDTYIDDALHYHLSVEMGVIRSVGGKPEQWKWVPVVNLSKLIREPGGEFWSQPTGAKCEPKPEAVRLPRIVRPLR